MPIFPFLGGEGTPENICPVDYAEFGRFGIGVDQQQGGQTYPFVRPSDDISRLAADFYLAYEDPILEHPLPLKVAWLYGFGCLDVGAPAGRPTPTHDYDLIVEDANGEVVFDSTVATSYTTKDWGDRLRIIEWQTVDKVCRLVIHIAWSPEDSPIDYAENFEPENGTLDARTWELLPRRVRSIRLEGQGPVGSGTLRLQNGYNTEIEVVPALEVDGGRAQTNVDFSAAAGSGQGRFPGCVENVYVRRINGIAADERGNFLLDGSNCYRIERPSEITQASPRLADVTPASLQMSNDCGPCCECDYFVRVYEGIRKLYNQYLSLGQRAEAARDQYRANRSRWIEGGRVRVSEPLRLTISPASQCRVAVAGGYCNTSGSQLTEVELRFSFIFGPPENVEFPDITANTSIAGEVVCGTTFRAGNFRRSTRTTQGRASVSSRERYEMAGEWPVYRAFFQNLPAGGLAHVTFLMQFPNCDTSDVVEVVLEAFNAKNGQLLEYPVTWPATDEMAAVTPLKTVTAIFRNDPCSVSSVIL